MTNKERVARGSGQHTDHRQPDIGYTLWGVATKAYAQHVRQSLEQRPRVLLPPVGVLSNNTPTTGIRLYDTRARLD